MQNATDSVQEQEALPAGDPAADARAAALVEPSPALARSDAHAALARVLPGLERYSRRLIPEGHARRLSISHEDLVQFAALVALARLDADLRAGNPPAEWWLSDARLENYLRGVMWRRLKRTLRDRREAPVSITPELVTGADEPAPFGSRDVRRRVRACLAGFSARELRLFARFGRGRSYEELAPRIQISPAALAKRRVRALADLRDRCRNCPLRREHGCAWIPRGWLGSA